MASTRPKINPGRLISLVDYKWRTDRLPFEDIVVPMEDLPDPDAEHCPIAGLGGAFMNGGQNVHSGAGFRYQPHETLRELERKWNDLALYRIYRTAPGSSGTTVSRSLTNAPTRSSSATVQGSGGSAAPTSSGPGI